MEDYGQLLDDFDPKKEAMYNAFHEYFNRPIMTKIKDVNGYSMYMSKTYCLLTNECRYIIVFIKQDSMPIFSKESLLNLRWDSLQTRTLIDQHKLPAHGYQPKSIGPLSAHIDRKEIKPECSIYSCDIFPISVTLLHGKGGASEYQQKGTIIAALETYNTIIVLNS